MSKTWMIAALAAVGLGATAAPHATPTSLCTIRAVQVPGGLMLDAEAHGRPGQSGSYRFELEKHGAGGDSNVSQGGDFRIAASGTSGLASTELNLDRGDTYRAVMTISGDVGSAHCTSQGDGEPTSSLK